MPPKREKFHDKRNRRPKFQNRGPPKKKEYRHQDQLTEIEVGITEFINTSEGFSGIIKARFSDFQVNEINLEGTVAKLTDTSVPKDFVSKIEQIDYNDVVTTPIENIPQETWDALKKVANGESAESVMLEADSLNKEERTEIHKCVKTHFAAKIVASTVTVNEKKYLEFKKYDKNDTSSERFQWPEDKGEYVHFLVYKEAMDTMDACLKISDCLKMSPSSFSYAGVKDRRSKSTQWFCVQKVAPWKLVKKTKPVRNLKVGNFTFKDEPLKLGQLQGNKFRIALRNVMGTDALINQSMNSVKENGFINYYGLQRFGNDKEVPTYEIGINLLLGKWKEAAQLILKPKSSDDPDEDVTKAKKIYFDTEDAAKAREVLENSKNRCVEGRLLQGLEKEGKNDYVNALENIPRNMRLLYIHSFQSLIWNKMVSKRLQTFGLKPVEGDFVLLNTNEYKAPLEVPENIDEHDVEEFFKCKQEVKAITAEETSKYTIYDIVLPLPGYDITYPENLKQYYKEALEEHGLTLEMTRQKVRTYTLCGNYRKILEKVKNVSWKIMQYNNPIDNLIRSDLEELRGDPEPKSAKDGKYKALVTEFDLSASSYATMVLREVLKMDTSSSAQARLNDYHEAGSKKKIIIESGSTDADKLETCDAIQRGSLLADAEKYKEFQNSIFKDILASAPEKRKNEEGDEERADSKKQKKEEADSEQTL